MHTDKQIFGVKTNTHKNNYPEHIIHMLKLLHKNLLLLKELHGLEFKPDDEYNDSLRRFTETITGENHEWEKYLKEQMPDLLAQEGKMADEFRSVLDEFRQVASRHSAEF